MPEPGRPSAKNASQPAPAAAQARIEAFVSAARRWAAARLLLVLVVDAILAAVALGLVATFAAAWSVRGDLARLGWQVGEAGAIAIMVGLGVAGARRRWWTPMHAARTLARTRGPLRPGAIATEAARDDALRHEILGALELAHAVERGDGERVTGSAALVRRYVDEVAARLRASGADPRLALPRPRVGVRLAVATALVVTVGLAFASPTLSRGFTLLVTGTDGRPPTPPEPVWSALTLDLRYPAHTRRPPRTVPNPSGALRVPAGTEIAVGLTARRPARAGRVLLAHDPTELGAAPPPEIVELEAVDGEGMRWEGRFTARGPGSWTLVLLDDEDDAIEDASRRSAALPLQLEPDRAPEVELMPLPRGQREVSDTDQVDVRFVARDDFGLVSAELVYQLPDGTTHRIPTTPSSDQPRTWRERMTWDIRQIPVKERSEVLYWIEVRDNDPGLGLEPLPDPPGKRTRSATMRLVVEDDETEHAQNIAKLAEIRDAAVDLLAVRMTTRAFQASDGSAGSPPVAVRAAEARDILSRSGNLLAMMAATIDALSVDTMARERDVATLTEIHRRLVALYRKELELHEAVPPGTERLEPDRAASVLGGMRRHNAAQIAQLEDEIIRLDDLVDGQIIERLEALVARLETTQRKIVELLEQLKAGDTSVRPLIDQLEQRRREDLRRIAEARAMLRREVDEEFMNLDAFAILQDMARLEQLSEMLRRNEVDRALEQARNHLGQMERLRDQVQQRLGETGESPALSEEDRQRMQLMRELSLLQDEQNTLRAQTRTLHERWRESVKDQIASEETRRKVMRTAQQLREALDEVNDARLGREGRRGLEDALEALERLEQLGEREDAGQLDLTEAAERVASGLAAAEAGADAKEAEGKAVGNARRRADALLGELAGGLPTPPSVFSDDEREQVDALRRRQRGLEERTAKLGNDPMAELLPPAGMRALERARREMDRGVRRLQDVQPGDTLPRQQGAWQALQEAIDSLRQGSPPPPAGATSGEASTEAERDRSLRDALMDAMREDAPDGFGESVKRYYQELLR